MPGAAIHSAIAYLPEAIHDLIPELRELAWPAETRATCDACRMRPRPGEPKDVPSFHASVGCCTYHPRLPNFLIGRQLIEDGEGAERLRARIRDGGGVSSWGIEPTTAWKERYAEGRRTQSFGREGFVRCPYLKNPTADTLHCTVWKDRGAVCRTWFCAHEDGPAGASLWRQLKSTLLEAERALAAWCTTQPGAPKDEVRPEVLEAWFMRCAELVEAVPAEAVASTKLDEQRDSLLAAWSELDDHAMPDVLAACLTHWFSEDEVIVYGYSAYDAVRVPTTLWQFLSRLDGHKPWEQAATEAGFAAADARELWRIAALEPPTDAHFGELEGMRIRMKTDGGEWVDLDPEAQ